MYSGELRLAEHQPQPGPALHANKELFRHVHHYTASSQSTLCLQLSCVYCVNYNCSHSQSQHVAYKEFAMVTISLWCVDSLNWFTGWG